MGFKIPQKLGRSGKLVEIRPLEESDFDEWKRAPGLMKRSRNLWDRVPQGEQTPTRARFRVLLREQRQRQKRDWLYDFGIFERATGAWMGRVSLMEVSRGVAQSAYLGYRLFNPYWGKGYATEAVELCLDLGFKDLGLHRIEAGIEPGNTRSIALAKKLGMRREGRKKRALYLRGQWVDLVMYTLTTEDLGLEYRGPLPRLIQR